MLLENDHLGRVVNCGIETGVLAESMLDGFDEKREKGEVRAAGLDLMLFAAPQFPEIGYVGLFHAGYESGALLGGEHVPGDGPPHPA
jgi:hypothetical protein